MSKTVIIQTVIIGTAGFVMCLLINRIVNPLLGSCFSMASASIIFPVIAIMVLRKRQSKSDKNVVHRHETVIGVISGCTGITLIQGKSIIDYFFFNRGRILTAFDLPVPELDLEAFLRISFTGLVIWLFMIFISIVASYIVSVLLVEK